LPKSRFLDYILSQTGV